MTEQTGEHPQLILSEERFNFPEQHAFFVAGLMPQNEKADNNAKNSHRIGNGFDDALFEYQAFIFAFCTHPTTPPALLYRDYPQSAI